MTTARTARTRRLRRAVPLIAVIAVLALSAGPLLAEIQQVVVVDEMAPPAPVLPRPAGPEPVSGVLTSTGQPVDLPVLVAVDDAGSKETSRAVAEFVAGGASTSTTPTTTAPTTTAPTTTSTTVAPPPLTITVPPRPSLPSLPTVPPVVVPGRSPTTVTPRSPSPTVVAPRLPRLPAPSTPPVSISPPVTISPRIPSRPAPLEIKQRQRPVRESEVKQTQRTEEQAPAADVERVPTTTITKGDDVPTQAAPPRPRPTITVPPLTIPPTVPSTTPPPTTLAPTTTAPSSPSSTIAGNDPAGSGVCEGRQGSRNAPVPSGEAVTVASPTSPIFVRSTPSEPAPANNVWAGQGSAETVVITGPGGTARTYDVVPVTIDVDLTQIDSDSALTIDDVIATENFRIYGTYKFSLGGADLLCYADDAATPDVPTRAYVEGYVYYDNGQALTADGWVDMDFGPYSKYVLELHRADEPGVVLASDTAVVQHSDDQPLDIDGLTPSAAGIRLDAAGIDEMAVEMNRYLDSLAREVLREKIPDGSAAVLIFSGGDLNLRPTVWSDPDYVTDGGLRVTYDIPYIRYVAGCGRLEAEDVSITLDIGLDVEGTTLTTSIEGSSFENFEFEGQYDGAFGTDILCGVMDNLAAIVTLGWYDNLNSQEASANAGLLGLQQTIADLDVIVFDFEEQIQDGLTRGMQVLGESAPGFDAEVDLQVRDFEVLDGEAIVFQVAVGATGTGAGPGLPAVWNTQPDMDLDALLADDRTAAGDPFAASFFLTNDGLNRMLAAVTEGGLLNYTTDTPPDITERLNDVLPLAENGLPPADAYTVTVAAQTAPYTVPRPADIPGGGDGIWTDNVARVVDLRLVLSHPSLAYPMLELSIDVPALGVQVFGHTDRTASAVGQVYDPQFSSPAGSSLPPGVVGVEFVADDDCSYVDPDLLTSCAVTTSILADPLDVNDIVWATLGRAAIADIDTLVSDRLGEIPGDFDIEVAPNLDALRLQDGLEDVYGPPPMQLTPYLQEAGGVPGTEAVWWGLGTDLRIDVDNVDVVATSQGGQEGIQVTADFSAAAEPDVYRWTWTDSSAAWSPVTLSLPQGPSYTVTRFFACDLDSVVKPEFCGYWIDVQVQARGLGFDMDATRRIGHDKLDPLPPPNPKNPFPGIPLWPGGGGFPGDPWGGGPGGGAGGGYPA